MKELKDQILSLPKAIQEKQIAMFDAERLLQENKLIVNSARINIYREVENEKLDGKPKFSNKDARDTETSIRVNGTYKVIIESIEEQKEIIKKLGFEFDFLKRSFRAYETLSRLGVN